MTLPCRLLALASAVLWLLAGRAALERHALLPAVRASVLKSQRRERPGDVLDTAPAFPSTVGVGSCPWLRIEGLGFEV